MALTAVKVAHSRNENDPVNCSHVYLQGHKGLIKNKTKGKISLYASSNY